MSDAIRLQKFLSEQGICSRRQAEQMIEEGRIVVNGSPAELGQKVTPGKEHVTVDGKPVTVSSTRTVVLVMHKPRDVICTHGDPHHEQTIYDLVPPPWNRERLLCAGRLDKPSEGMLILTNDGDLVQRLTHPSNRVVKRYRVLLTRPFMEAHIRILLQGFEEEGEFLKAEKVVPMKHGPDADKRLEIHLEHGRKREIRRMLEALGYRVKRLQRYQIGGLVMRGVGPGRVRLLKKKEIDLLFS